jgi:hypothetical protein
MGKSTRRHLTVALHQAFRSTVCMVQPGLALIIALEIIYDFHACDLYDTI